MDAIQTSQQLSAEFSKRADEADKAGKLPPEDIASLKASGYLALNIPKAYGGFERTMRDCLEAQMELAQGSGSTAIVAAMQMQVFGNARDTRDWDEENFERLCRIGATGGLFNAAASEPELGSPSRGGLFKTEALPRGDGYLIRGHKSWTTGGKHLTHIIVGVCADGQNRSAVVENNVPGIEWIETWGDGLSLRASESHDLLLHDVRISEADLIGKSPNPTGRKAAWFPMVLASTYLGIAHAARNTVIRYALERVPAALGKSISTLPKIQRMIGQVDMLLQAARALLLEVAAECDAGEYSRVAAAKHFAVEVANEVTDSTLKIAGGAGITRQLPLERYFRDVRAGSMQPPSGDTALEAIGKNAIESSQRT